MSSYQMTALGSGGYECMHCPKHTCAHGRSEPWICGHIEILAP